MAECGEEFLNTELDYTPGVLWHGMALLLLIIHKIQSPRILTIKVVLQLDKSIELDNSIPYRVFNCSRNNYIVVVIYIVCHAKSLTGRLITGALYL